MIKKMMTAPCSLNTEPYLTEWHADLESGVEIWIQTSETEEMKWERLGNLYERAVLADKPSLNIRDWIKG